MKHILLAIDGTGSGKAARELGLRLAHLQGASVTGLAALDEQSMTGPEAVPLGASAYKARRDARHVQSDRVYLENELASFTAEAAGKGVKSTARLVEGEAVKVIVAEAASHDVIIMGRTTTFDLGQETGSLAIVTQLLAEVPRPVIVTPDSVVPDGDVLVAHDGSVSSARSLQLFALLGDAWRTRRVVVLTVDQDAERARLHAQQASDYLSAHGYTSSARPVASTHEPATLILQTANDMKAGLIVQGAFGNRSWLDFLLGTTTTAMLGSTRVPLFLSH